MYQGESPAFNLDSFFFIIEIIFNMKNLTDFRKTLKIGVLIRDWSVYNFF